MRPSPHSWTTGVDMNELPEPWNTAAEHAGVTQSLRGIASAAGVSHVTVGRLIRQGRTSPQTVSAVAAALRISEAKVYEYAGISLSDLGPWIPPLEAHRLNPRARAALSELILAITEGEGGSSAATGGCGRAVGDGGRAEGAARPSELFGECLPGSEVGVSGPMRRDYIVLSWLSARI